MLAKSEIFHRDNSSFTQALHQLCRQLWRNTEIQKNCTWLLRNKSLNIPESERVAGNARCRVGESIVTDRSPRVVVENFKTTVT